MAVSNNKIIVKGARVHNLKNIDVEIEKGSFTVVTGVSGSGKSSLVFDTLFAEGQRRYVESLSSYARQFLGRMNKPEVDFISGLSPAIAIEQKVNTRNPRSTIATSTEIYDYLKLLFSRAGKTISPISGNEVKKHNTQDVVEFICQFDKQEVVIILSEIIFDKKTPLNLNRFTNQGFSRILWNNELVKIEDFDSKKLKAKDELFLVIDRLLLDEIDEDFINRCSDSVESAFWEGKGECFVFNQNNFTKFSNRFEMDNLQFEVPNENMLSYNNPIGACKTCEGFGTVLGIDNDLVISNPQLSVYEGCVNPWNGETMSEWRNDFVKKAIEFDFPIHRSYSELTEKEKDLLWNGNKKVNGINEFFKFVETQLYKIQYRVMLSRYKGKTNCPDCLGTRLRKDASYIKLISNHTNPSTQTSIQEVLLMTVKDALSFFENLKLSEKDQTIAERILLEIKNRLTYLNLVGLNYLTLNRLSNSLSGGESQRINLATSLGSSLTGSMYILDEPSIGLHPRDTEKLISVLNNLKKIGNTVIVVEHEEEMMRAADQIIDIGPKAGNFGGELIFSGDIKSLNKSKDSLTAQYLTGKTKIEIPQNRRKWSHKISIKNAFENNLKNIDVHFPLNVLTCVTGVSGSGKTTLVKNILYPSLAKIKAQFVLEKTGKSNGIEGDFHLIKQVEIVDQNPIGKSSRSNPATYVKVYDEIRDFYANQPIAKKNNLKPGHFSFNVDGGRCDTCKGEGEVTIEMQFIADLKLQCEDCEGKRFKADVLEVSFKDKNISDVLNMSVDTAMEFFKDQKNIIQKLEPLQKVGLGYVSLGQSSSLLSGGESQRIKLATFLSKGYQNQQPTFFIFDEPTTGLHFHDVKTLLKCFNELIVNGHTVLVIEHNMEVIKSADWIIDLGPEGGNEGGYLNFCGTPEDLIKEKNNYTAQFLKDKLS